MCNDNFNQCFQGPYYPCPVCRARRFFINTPTTIVVNPTIANNWAFFNIASPQNVWDQSNLVVTKQSSSGIAINDNIDGSSYLRGGTYHVEYTGSAIIPSDGLLSVALFIDGVVLGDSVATVTGGSGTSVNISGRAVFTLPINGGVLTLKNISGQTITTNRIAMTVNKIK